VRKKRRVELHIEHREISVFATRGPMSTYAPAHSSDFIPPDAGLLDLRAAACPTCGSSNLVLLADAITRNQLDLAALNQGMQDGSVHVHRSPAGEWRICTQSLPQN
jgi:hypothetical protein